jgi:hypothetical protein
MSKNSHWTPEYASKFVKALQGTSTNFKKDTAFLARSASMTINELLATQPLYYCVKVWPFDNHYKRLSSIIDPENYENYYDSDDD